MNWSADDAWIVTGSHDNTAKVWDTKTGRLVVEINRHQESVTAVTFTP